MAIADLLRRLFADDGVEVFDAAQPARRAGPASDDDLLLERLGRLLRDRRSVLSGNIHLIGLQRIRDRAGSEWPRIADRARDITLKVLQRFCGPDDLFTRYDDLSFLVIFPALPREQAQLRCHDIGEEIGRRLLGEKFSAEAAAVSTGVFEVDGSLIFSTVNRQDLIQRLLSGDAVKNTEEDPPSLAEDVLPDFSFAQLDKTKALASMELMYRPMWNLRHKAIANYFAAAGALNIFGGRVWDSALRREYEGVLSPAEFDTYIARRALRDMAANVARGQKVLLCWPIHFETMAGRIGRSAYIDLCREIPDTVRQLLIFELDGMPQGTPQSRLLDVLAVLKPFCRGQIVRVPWNFRQFGPLTGIGLNGVGFDLSMAPRDDGDRINILNDFSAAAAKVGLRCYAHGLSSRAQALAALAAGFEWINGDAVERMVDLPGQMMRFNLDDLYRGV